MMDYEGLAKSRLTSAFKDRLAIETIVTALPKQLSLLEVVADQVRDGRSVDTAIGIQLDKIGIAVGEPRLGRTDDVYRLAIKFRVFVNVSKGRPSDLIYVTRGITEADNVQYMESFPATAILYTDGYGANKSTQAGVQDVAPAAISTVPVLVSFGSSPLRLSRNSSEFDSESELAGVQLGVFVTMARKRLLTLDGRRIRVKQNYSILQSNLKLTGVFQ